MSDLVERLRALAARKWPYAPNQTHSLFGEAARHIDRLTAELAEREALAAERWEQMQADRKQALTWRDERDAANAVIDELLACKDLESSIRLGSDDYLKQTNDLRKRLPLAWKVARALRKGTT